MPDRFIGYTGTDKQYREILRRQLLNVVETLPGGAGSVFALSQRARARRAVKGMIKQILADFDRL